MTGEHKSYGCEGGYEGLTSNIVFSNMRIGAKDNIPEDTGIDVVEENDVVEGDLDAIADEEG